jgi:hypothetical protein
MEMVMNLLQSNPGYKNYSAYHFNWATTEDYFKDLNLLANTFKSQETNE